LNFNDLQHRCTRWVFNIFGEDCATDQEERGKRVYEESAELLQASGVSLLDALKILWWVYSRPSGELTQELAGVGVTLFAAASAAGESIGVLISDEMSRVESLPKEKFLAKRKLKQEAGITLYGG
jgi:hypothetical protein